MAKTASAEVAASTLAATAPACGCGVDPETEHDPGMYDEFVDLVYTHSR